MLHQQTHAAKRTRVAQSAAAAGPSIAASQGNRAGQRQRATQVLHTADNRNVAVTLPDPSNPAAVPDAAQLMHADAANEPAPIGAAGVPTAATTGGAALRADDLE